MAGKYLAGIDVGTTGAKCGILDLNGNLIASGYREHGCSYPKPNWVEQDADLLVANAMEAAREAVAKSGIVPTEIASVSLSSQRCCTLFLDAEGKLIRPLISWQDNRTSAEVEEIRQKISNSDYYKITGLPINTTWMLSKILWLRKNEPANWERVRKIIQNQDLVLKAFGADDYYVDVSDAVFYGIWDPYNFDWSQDLIDRFQIDRALLPKATPSGTCVGAISSQAAERSGFTVGTPLCVGAGDQNSAAVGAGIVTDGFLSVSIGTAGSATAYLSKPYRDPKGVTMVTNHAIYGTWQIEGYQASAAGVYRWFRDEIATLEKAYAQEAKKDVYEILNELVAKTPAGARGLVFLPYYASATSPRWNPFARGTLCGLTFNHDRGCLARAFLEGITLDMRDILTEMLSSGIEIKTVRLLGGASKSALWNQIHADVYNRPVETLKTPDAAVLGAAILGGVGVGLFGSVPEAVQHMVRVAHHYEPNPENTGIYDDLYGVFCQMYEGLEEKGAFRSLAAIQERY
jgi:xylulokinase